MKHGIFILAILMALLSLPESGYASVPFFTVVNDTIRRVVSYDAEPEIMKLYSTCRQFTFDLQYSARKKAMGKELFILGPGVQMPQIPSLECIRAAVAAQDVQA